MGKEILIVIDEAGHTIPVKVFGEGDEHVITVDGVEWVRTKNQMHATVLFHMMVEHLTEYMNYEVR